MANNESWWLKLSKGFLLVISGPSGSGKGTVSNELLSRNDDVVFSVSATTRKPRINETEGLNYIFLEKDKFGQMVEQNQFLEHAFVHNNYYGTPKDFVMKQINKPTGAEDRIKALSEEMGDVILNVKLLAKKLDIEEIVEERVKRKLKTLM